MSKTRFLMEALSMLVLVTSCQPQEAMIAAGRMGEVGYLFTWRLRTSRAA